MILAPSLLVAACAGPTAPQAAPTDEAVRAPSVTVGPSATGGSVPGAPITSAPGAGTAAARPFVARIEPIDEALAARMARSWRPGCPVPLDDLRRVALVHWGLDGAVHDGELVVHRDVADAMVSVFAALYDARFPIERMRLVDDYDADDQASMRANNTSAFNCREVAGRPGVWSEHATGRAIDVNPFLNPWVRGSVVDPPEAAAYADRTRAVPGLVLAGGPVVAAFRAVGWGWGGDWSGGQDWQHFSASGR